MRHQLAQQELRFFRHAPEIASVDFAEPMLQLLLRLTIAGVNLPAVAARRTEGDGLSLDQDGARAGIHQMQRCRQSGETAADDADIGAQIAR